MKLNNFIYCGTETITINISVAFGLVNVIIAVQFHIKVFMRTTVDMLFVYGGNTDEVIPSISA